MMMSDILKNSVGKTATEKVTKEKVTIMGVGVTKNRGREEVAVHFAAGNEIKTLDMMAFVLRYTI